MKKRDRGEFLNHVEQAFKRDPIANTAESVAQVFALPADKITFGEIEDVWHALPADIREMWPQSMKDALAATH